VNIRALEDLYKLASVEPGSTGSVDEEERNFLKSFVANFVDKTCVALSTQASTNMKHFTVRSLFAAKSNQQLRLAG
jgi:hypothetical protein